MTWVLIKRICNCHNKFTMCGRAACTLAPAKLLEETGAQSWVDGDDNIQYQTYNAAPTSALPVLVTNFCGNNGCVIKLMKWGIIPSYSKTGVMEGSTFNARLDTLMTKPMYRRLVKRQRCVAVVDGFYEWKSGGLMKEPHYISSSDSNVLYFAGLYDCWESADGKFI